MSFSLRIKICILMAISLCLALIPIISFTYTDVRKSTIELEHKSFNNVAILVEDSIIVHYLNNVSEQVKTILQYKEQLRHTSAVAQSLWQDNATLSSTERTSKLESLAQSFVPYNLYLNMFNENNDLIINHGLLNDLIQDEQCTDYKERSLRQVLAEPLPSEGACTVFYMYEGTSEEIALLVCCLPSSVQDTIAITALILTDSNAQIAATKREIAHTIQKKLDTLELSSHGFISVFSGDGERLAYKGLEVTRNPNIIPKEALDQAKKEKHSIYHAEDIGKVGSAFFNISYIKALDWFVVVSAPQSEIEASTNSLIQSLISIALGAVFISIICTVYFANRLVQPLRTLTHKTHELSTVDFAHGNVEAIVNDLPSQQGDEVGQLAKAFESMAKDLSYNVRELMETASVKDRMQGELNAATDIQMGILPAADTAPKLSNYEAAPFLEPAKEVGGDLYDFFTAPDGRQVVIIGDVSGKGVPAALFMSMTVTLCRYAISSGMSPAEAMMRINDQLSANNPSCMFVTLFIGLFDPETGVLEYANGGHCPPCIVHEEGNEPAFYSDAMSGPLVGAMDGMDYMTQSITLELGQRCLLYSDGVTEAMNEDLQLFSDPYLLEVMTTLRQASPQEVVDGVYAAILKHRGTAEPSDDITMLCFMRK